MTRISVPTEKGKMMREELIEILRVPIYPHKLADPTEAVADYLLDNDVVPVVRCKDCKKRYKPNECPMCILVYGEQHDFTQENGYCDRGERRTDV